MPGDFRIAAGIFDHPKFKLLVRRLEPSAGLCLFRLWAFCTVNKTTGDLAGMTVEEIEMAADWNGEIGLFVKTLVELKLMDLGEGGALQVHDWSDHNPWAVGSQERSDKARFSRLAQTNPKLHKELRKEGVIKISSKEMADLTNRQRNANETPAPSPFLSVSLPSPSPILSLPSQEEDSSSSSLGGPGETMKTKTAIFSNLYFETFGRKMPTMLDKAAADCCERFTSQQIGEAFQLGAEHGASSYRYIEAVLHDKDTERQDPLAHMGERVDDAQSPNVQVTTGSRWHALKTGKRFEAIEAYGAYVELRNISTNESRTVSRVDLLDQRLFEEEGANGGCTDKPAGYFAGDFPDRSSEWGEA